jgi:hypothetical protein
MANDGPRPSWFLYLAKTLYGFEINRMNGFSLPPRGLYASKLTQANAEGRGFATIDDDWLRREHPVQRNAREVEHIQLGLVG